MSDRTDEIQEARQEADDVQIGALRYDGRPLGTRAQVDKDYIEPPMAPFFDKSEFRWWSFWRAGIAEFLATLLYIYISIGATIGNARQGLCQGVGRLGVAWAFGGTMFVLVYCTAGISGGHINPAVTFGLLLARKISINRAFYYIVCQVLGAICGAGVVKGFQTTPYEVEGGGANVVAHGYTRRDGLGAEIVGTFVLVYVVFSAFDSKRQARDSHTPILTPLPIGFAVLLVHLAPNSPVIGTGVNPARSLGTAVIYNRQQAWNDQWIFWVGPFIGAALAAAYYTLIIRAFPFKKRERLA